MERNVDAQIERERRIQESKRIADYYRQLSWSRNCNPDLTMSNCLQDNKHKTKQSFVDDVLIKK